jgi:Xaa-Pro aminopeptidase
MADFEENPEGIQQLLAEIKASLDRAVNLVAQQYAGRPEGEVRAALEHAFTEAGIEKSEPQFSQYVKSISGPGVSET